MKNCSYLFIFLPLFSFAQLKWNNVDTGFSTLPSSFHVYYTNDSLDGKPNSAYYAIIDLKDRHLTFTVDTTLNRRLTPNQYFEKNKHPYLVVNCTFFEFVHNSNLNVVMKDGKILSFNNSTIAGRGKDTLTYQHVFASAIGIDKKGNADVAWTLSDSTQTFIYASQAPIKAIKDSFPKHDINFYFHQLLLKKWKMKTAVGGGPVLLQNGVIKITNNEELKFAGKAINDKHPRTCMGYTKDNKLIVLVIEGRFPGKAEGATLEQEAKMLKDIGCVEAINLDGGGSSCMLINGKQTITPSDKEGQRPLPAVFIIQSKNNY
jgi:exopolysaccharide biosynthesis protein